MMIRKIHRPRSNSNTKSPLKSDNPKRGGKRGSAVSLVHSPRNSIGVEATANQLKFIVSTLDENKHSKKRSYAIVDATIGVDSRTSKKQQRRRKTSKQQQPQREQAKFSLQENLNPYDNYRIGHRSRIGSPKAPTSPTVSANGGNDPEEVVEYGSRQFYHRRKSTGNCKNSNDSRRRKSRSHHIKLFPSIIKQLPSSTTTGATIASKHSNNTLKRASIFVLKQILPSGQNHTADYSKLAQPNSNELVREDKRDNCKAESEELEFDSQLLTPNSTSSPPGDFQANSPDEAKFAEGFRRFSFSQANRPQMEHRHKIRPVQLFAPSSHNPNILRLNKNALNAVLGHASLANKKVVVISVAGAYRKGKSFLLNFFLEYLYILQYAQKNDVDMDWLQDETELEGFRYRPGPKRDTVGVWIWAEPIMIDAANGERYAVILMDTQGCFEQNQLSTSATNNNNSHNHNHNSSNNNANSDNNNNNSYTLNNNFGSVTNLNNSNNVSNNANAANYAALALSTMLSCVQIYNFAEFIPEEAINALRFFTEYGKLAASEAPQFGKPFQKLVMVIRDFKISEEMTFGFEGGSKLLEKALRQAAAAENDATENDAAANLRQIRQHIRQCFNDGVSCCLLPHPGPKICDSSTPFRGHVKDIKPTFREEIRRFVESLIGPNLIKPKIVNGKQINVRKFVECIREYAKIFESPDLPTPRNVLNVNIQLSCIDYAFEAKIAYCRGMDRATRSSRMMAEKKLLEAHIKHGIKALNIYDRCPKIDSGDIRNQSLARLQESINHELERYKRMNEEKRVTTCASAMLACGDSALFGLGLGGAASGAVAASIVTLQLGVVSAGIVAIPVSLSALFGIWVYVTLKPSLRVCLGLERDS